MLNRFGPASLFEQAIEGERVMSIFGSVLRIAVLAMGLATMSAGAALACDNCQRHDDSRYHDGYEHDGYRDDGYRHDGWRDGDRRDDCRDHCERHDDGCRENCYRHEDGCHDGCRRADTGCHDNCYRHYDGCHEGCGRSENYSCYSGRFDCRFEGGTADSEFRARYYDGHDRFSGGEYGFYGE
jgi:hypothetical protein